MAIRGSLTPLIEVDYRSSRNKGNEQGYTVTQTIQNNTVLEPGTIEQGDWKRTIDHYCIIIYEHTMLVVGVFKSENIMFQNRTKMTFPQTHGPISN